VSPIAVSVVAFVDHAFAGTLLRNTAAAVAVRTGPQISPMPFLAVRVFWLAMKNCAPSFHEGTDAEVAGYD
jgi:hypothetical protein